MLIIGATVIVEDECLPPAYCATFLVREDARPRYCTANVSQMNGRASVLASRPPFLSRSESRRSSGGSERTRNTTGSVYLSQARGDHLHPQLHHIGPADAEPLRGAGSQVN